MPDVTTQDLIAAGHLRVEDGNHGNDRPRPHEFGDTGIAFIRAADMSSGTVDFAGSGKITDQARERIRKGVGQPGDILLSHKGTVGRVAIAPPNSPAFVCSPQTTFWRSLNHGVVDPGYLSVVLRSEGFQEQLRVLGGQTDMAPYVSLTDQRRLMFPLPEIHTQHGIAEVLGALDDKIAANISASTLSDQLIDAAFRRAVSQEAEARPLFDVFEIDFGEAFKGSSFSDPGIGRPLIRIRDLKTFSPQIWSTETRSQEVMAQPGDVLVGMDAEFRASWWLGAPGLINQRVCRVRCKGAGSAFVASALQEPLARLQGEKAATTVIHLNKSDLERSTVLWPSQNRLVQFESTAEPLLHRRIAAAQESTRLAATRDELLPLLMSRRVTVREAERTVKAAM